MSAAIQVTHHAASRCAQRGLSDDDLRMVELLGLEVPDGYLLCEQQARKFATVLRHCADRVEKLVGARLVTQRGRLVTAYRTTRAKQRRLAQHTYDSAEGF